MISNPRGMIPQLVFARCLILVLLLARGAAEEPVVLRHVTIVDRGTRRADATLVVDQGKIPAIGAPAAGALASATSEGAAFLCLQDETGSVVPGKAADLVLLRGDPLADIRNTRAIAAVVVRGRYFSLRSGAAARSGRALQVISFREPLYRGVQDAQLARETHTGGGVVVDRRRRARRAPVARGGAEVFQRGVEGGAQRAKVRAVWGRQRYGDGVAQPTRIGEQGHVRGDSLRRLGHFAQMALEGGVGVRCGEAEGSAGGRLRARVGEHGVEVLAEAVEQGGEPLRELVTLAAWPEKLRCECEPAADQRALDADARQVPVAAQHLGHEKKDRCHQQREEAVIERPQRERQGG